MKELAEEYADTKANRRDVDRWRAACHGYIAGYETARSRDKELVEECSTVLMDYRRTCNAEGDTYAADQIRDLVDRLTRPTAFQKVKK